MTAPTHDLTHFGRYRIVAELGRGAMGVVYRATDESLQRDVAIKTIILPTDAAERATLEARFRQEAKAAGGLNHPHVITIYDIGREGDWLYLAMELLEGNELRGLIASRRLSLHDALEIAAQVADGLAAAHARGVVHRDIKPSNIMVIHGNHAKIMDFGIARVQVSDVKTQTGMVLGSPKYMSPEQVSANPIDHRSDIFSLGAIVYECATGAAPFTDVDLSHLMFAIINTTPPAPSLINRNVPQMLDLIIGKAMHKQADMRYQHAAEFARDLRACRAQLVASAVGEGGTQDTQTVLLVPGTDDASPRTMPTQVGTGHTTGHTTHRAQMTLSLPLSRQFDSTQALLRLAAFPSCSGAGAAKTGVHASIAAMLRNRGQLTWTTAILLALLCAALIVMV